MPPLCPRPRLLSTLGNAQKHQPFIWIGAPAGSGKTSLALEYIQKSDRPYLWMCVDDDDEDLATFFFYFSQAAQTLGADLGKFIFTPAHRDGLPAFSRSFARKLLEDIPENAVLVLDNLESVSFTSEVHDVVISLIRELGRGQTLVVTSRTEPPAAYASLLARDGCFLLSNADLKFSLEETRALHKLRGQDQSPSPEALFDWAHGWVAGMVLGLQHSGVHSPAPKMPNLAPTQRAPQVVFDYFAAEVFQELDDDESHFLLQTSVYKEFRAEQAQALVQNVPPPAQSSKFLSLQSDVLLEKWVEQSFFVVRLLEGAQTQYRYHPLFRAFLCKRRSELYSESEEKRLYLEAAHALVAHGDVEEAVELFSKAGAFADLDALLCQHAPKWLAQGWHRRVLQWATLPKAYSSSAELQYWRGMAGLPFSPREARQDFETAYARFVKDEDVDRLFECLAAVMECIVYSWEMAELEPWMDNVERLLERFGEPSEKIFGRLAAAMFNAINFRRLGTPSLEKWAKIAQEMLYNPSRVNPGDFMLLANSMLVNHCFFGRFEQARGLLESIRFICSSDEVPPIAQVVFHFMQTMVPLYEGKMEESHNAAKEGLAYAEAVGIHFCDVHFYSVGGIASLTAHPETSAAFSQHLVDIGHPYALSQHEFIQLWLATQRGDFEQALLHAHRSVKYAEIFGSKYTICTTTIGLCQVHLARKDYQNAGRILAKAREEIVQISCWPQLIRCVFLKAEIHLMKGEHDDKLVALAEGFRLARERQFVGMGLWRRTIMAQLCGQALRAGIEKEYIRIFILAEKVPAPEGYEAEWPGVVQIFTLGRFNVVIDGNELRFSGKSQKRPLDFLQVLCAFGGQISEAKMAAILWPDAEGDSAAQSVKSTLHRLRKLIGAATLERGEGMVRLTNACWVDALDAMQIFQKLPVDRGVEELRRAVELYRGPLLPDVEASFVFQPRRKLEQSFVTATLELSSMLQERGEKDAAQKYLEKGAELSPGVEALYVALVVFFRSQGQGAKAADVFRRGEQALSALHGAKPSEEFIGSLTD